MDEVKAAAARELTDAELAVALKDLDEKLFRVRLRQVTENINYAGEVRALRRSIARVKTIMRERELAGREKNE